MNIRKFVLLFPLLFLCAYIFVGFLLFFQQKSFLYFPSEQDFDECYGFSDYQTRETNGTRFYFLDRDPERVVVHYHGNAGSTCDRSVYKYVFEDSGASLMFVEYAGYSNDSDNRPSQKNILNDIRNIHHYITDQGYQDITIYGQSLGAAAASYHASLGNVDDLILVTPFSRLRDLAQDLYPFYPVSLILTEHYDNIEWLSQYSGRLLILHPENDPIIPSRFSQILFDSVQTTSDKNYVLIPNRGHNDLWLDALFRDVLLDFLNRDK